VIHRLLAHALIVASVFAITTATAGSAHYYLYMSKEDGSRICTQVAPGTGWKKMDGPFVDAICRKRPK
jgi:hypothetical protein